MGAALGSFFAGSMYGAGGSWLERMKQQQAGQIDMERQKQAAGLKYDYFQKTFPQEFEGEKELIRLKATLAKSLSGIGDAGSIVDVDLNIPAQAMSDAYDAAFVERGPVGKRETVFSDTQFLNNIASLVSSNAKTAGGRPIPIGYLSKGTLTDAARKVMSQVYSPNAPLIKHEEKPKGWKFWKDAETTRTVSPYSGGFQAFPSAQWKGRSFSEPKRPPLSFQEKRRERARTIDSFISE